MKITYIVHDQSGIPGDKVFTVHGSIAKAVLEYENKQEQVGITILEIEYL